MAGTLGSLAPHLAFFALLLAANLTYFGLVEFVNTALGSPLHRVAFDSREAQPTPEEIVLVSYTHQVIGHVETEFSFFEV